MKNYVIPLAVMAYEEEEGALPLVDHELDEPGMRDYVNSLILAEMEAMALEGLDEAAYASRLPRLPGSLLSATIELELAAAAPTSHAPTPPALASYFGCSVGPFQAPPPIPGPGSIAPDVQTTATRGIGVALEAQGVLSLNVELASRYGVEAWRAAVGDSSTMTLHLRREEDSLAAEVQAVNARRMAAQEASAVRLTSLKRRLEEVQASNFALAVALGAKASRQD